MREYIDRMDAIKTVAQLYRYESDRMTALQELPTIEVGWIPVSERLPGDNIKVIVTFENKDRGRFTGEAWLQEGRWIYKRRFDESKVVAWQLPPEPWKGEE